MAFLISNYMSNTETSLPKIYRCRIEDTGRKVATLNPFTIPMIPKEPIIYTHEKEIGLYFPESSYREFVNDFEIGRAHV